MTFYFPVPFNWKQNSRRGVSYGYASVVRTAGYNPRQYGNHCPRTSEEPYAPRVDPKRALLYGFAWNLVGIFEPDGDQCASRSRHSTGRMDRRTRTRSIVWLDRQLHSRYRILFTTCAWAFGPPCASLLLRALDLRCGDAVVRKHLWMALACAPPRLRGI